MDVGLPEIRYVGEAGVDGKAAGSLDVALGVL